MLMEWTERFLYLNYANGVDYTIIPQGHAPNAGPTHFTTYFSTSGKDAVRHRGVRHNSGYFLSNCAALCASKLMKNLYPTKLNGYCMRVYGFNCKNVYNTNK